MTTTATLVGSGSPQRVQIVVSATTNGVAWTVTGTAAGYTWVVPGGKGTGDGGQLVLVDNRGPLNVPITYTYKGSATENASPVTRTASGDIVLQTLDGQTQVSANLMVGSADVSHEVRNALFAVPGRRRPVIRYSATSDAAGSLVIRVPTSLSEDFDDLLATGAPLIWLMGKTTFDLDPVAPFIITSASSSLMDTLNKREWVLGYALVDDPYMDTRLGAYDWDYFETRMAAKTWANFDTLFTGKSWNLFDAQDWSVV